jgi:hypothetical protein
LREYGYGFAVGPHFELSNSNYIETGYLRQYTTDLLHSIAIPGYLTETSLTANYSVSSLISATACPNSAKSCPGPFPAVSLSYNEVRQNGIYGMAVWHSTVPGYKQITNQWVFFGDWFGQGNPITRSSTETHYAANLSDTLTVSIAGNLSLGPQYTIFLFGDESSVQPNSLVRQQLSVALNYNFDWHYGLSWRSLWTPVK